MSEFVPVVEVDRLSSGIGKTVVVKGREYAVFNSNGEFFTIDNECPHAGAPLGDGFCHNGLAVCPLHGWLFNLKTGVCPTNLAKSVRTYPTRVIDGWVQICVD